MSGKGYAEDIGDFTEAYLDDEKACDNVDTLVNEGNPIIFVEELDELTRFGITDVEEV